MCAWSKCSRDARHDQTPCIIISVHEVSGAICFCLHALHLLKNCLRTEAATAAPSAKWEAASGEPAGEAPTRPTSRLPRLHALHALGANLSHGRNCGSMQFLNRTGEHLWGNATRQPALQTNMVSSVQFGSSVPKLSTVAICGSHVPTLHVYSALMTNLHTGYAISCSAHGL